ncbi:MAG: transposase [Methylococcales bacterium]|nr:transposase [Methylococcales bacterium]
MLKPHTSSLRRGRYSEASRIYLITTITECREHVFDDLIAARIVIKTLMEEQARENAETLAFVFMPDHLHWLMQLGNDKPLFDVVATIKSVSAHRLGRKIWQDGFHDHALRKEEDVQGTARYVVANPLRAGLVKNIGDYPHWYAKWL